MNNFIRSSSETKYITEKKKHNTISKRLHYINYMKTNTKIKNQNNHKIKKEDKSDICKEYLINLKNILKSLFSIKNVFWKDLIKYLKEVN